MIPFRSLLLLLAGLASLAPIARAFDHSHALFDRVLKAQVRDGRVNYAALQAAPKPLDDYLAQLAAVTTTEFDGWSQPERLAFLINLYNAATLKLIIDHYPVKSIRSIGWLPGAAWKQEGVEVFGRKISLDELEHGIIRRDYREPRVHFALVCAARGCPPLREETFVGAHLDAQLEDQGKRFLGTAAKNRVDAASRIVYLSPIFKWFAEDFGGTDGAVLQFVAPFLSEEARRVLAAGDCKISYTDYDWSLNDQGSP
ncbi:DUF547 domain-containing protein [Opitutus terrae]|uniref:DUF547 domain-containing protein n=1 Tax=Opitutus terrae (strain DSM 11246 / JCM 15787 / PB90-1) TaxID=452637 RepID=B1ZQB7_OPITP|nr:DUF547 domain-containing protein [Opitutus terrae]ACB73597.1 protein of unknown function DUF547 [Opitutus terrae PB90-1]